MNLLALVIYLPIAAALLLFVYLTLGGWGLALVAVAVVLNAVSRPGASPPNN